MSFILFFYYVLLSSMYCTIYCGNCFSFPRVLKMYVLFVIDSLLCIFYIFICYLHDSHPGYTRCWTSYVFNGFKYIGRLSGFYTFYRNLNRFYLFRSCMCQFHAKICWNIKSIKIWVPIGYRLVIILQRITSIGQNLKHV